MYSVKIMLLILSSIFLMDILLQRGQAGVISKTWNAGPKAAKGLRKEVEINNETFYIALDGGYLTWYEAETKCNELGMQLVTFDSDERWTTISVWLRQNPDYDRWMWSSGYKAVGEDQFMWTSTGENFNYTDWNLGQPDTEIGSEACMNFYASFGGWDDDRCTEFSLTYMCEFLKTS